jgi:hypothetical protein
VSVPVGISASLPSLFVVDSMTPSVNVDLVMSWVEDNPEVISVTVKVDHKETENGTAQIVPPYQHLTCQFVRAM